MAIFNLGWTVANSLWGVLNLAASVLLFRYGVQILSNSDVTLSQAEADLKSAVDDTLTYEGQQKQALADKEAELEAAKANQASPEAIAAIEAEVKRLRDALPTVPTTGGVTTSTDGTTTDSPTA